MWVGATSNSHYQEQAKIFKRQEEFALSDLVVGEDGEKVVLPFTNIFDKGYRCILDASQAGKQQCEQPIFAKSDKHFTGDKLWCLHLLLQIAKGTRGMRMYVRSQGTLKLDWLHMLNLRD